MNKAITQKTNLVGRLISIAVIAVIGINSIGLTTVNALSGSSFNPGFIISDANFYNGYSLDSTAIQNWLNAQVPNCDTNGTQVTSHANGSGGYYTRAQWGSINGNPAPFTCLKNYRQDVGTVSANSYCSAISAGNKSAAEILMNVGRACNVSPMVLLVLLQKEQGLVTDDWPWNSQYRAATGFGCPDTAACDTNYAGFFNQVYWAAWQYQNYKANSTQFNYRAGRSQYIPYNPNGACGGTQVYIQNQATAGLYNYTPYQPNAAALNNLYGTGDSCSAYGNRNFWRIYNNWFGDPTAGCQNSPLNTKVLRLYDPKTFKHYYTIDYCEANFLATNVGYSLEGPAFSFSTSPGSQPIYRLYNTKTGIHYYATNQEDINHAIYGAGYHLEGVAFYVDTPNTPGTVPVYRMYNPKTFIHLWVLSQADIDGARLAGYQLEGVNFYALP